MHLQLPTNFSGILVTAELKLSKKFTDLIGRLKQRLSKKNQQCLATYFRHLLRARQKNCSENTKYCAVFKKFILMSTCWSTGAISQRVALIDSDQKAFFFKPKFEEWTALGVSVGKRSMVSFRSR